MTIPRTFAAIAYIFPSDIIKSLFSVPFCVYFRENAWNQTRQFWVPKMALSMEGGFPIHSESVNPLIKMLQK